MVSPNAQYLHVGIGFDDRMDMESPQMLVDEAYLTVCGRNPDVTGDNEKLVLQPIEVSEDGTYKNSPKLQLRGKYRPINDISREYNFDIKHIMTSVEPTSRLGFINNDEIEIVTILNSGNVGIGTTSPTSKLDINDDRIRIRTNKTPTGTSDSNGNTGDISWDDSYIYVKTSVGWKRGALTTW